MVPLLLVAALAGAGNQLATMPASVVATRMQAHAKLHTESSAAAAASGRPAAGPVPAGAGAWQTIQSIWRDDGPHATNPIGFTR